jgi:hypothetical protein
MVEHVLGDNKKEQVLGDNKKSFGLIWIEMI